MHHRQRIPRQWLVADTRLGDALWSVVRRLPRGSGVLVIFDRMPKGQRARLLGRLLLVARHRNLVVIDELRGKAVRVHDLQELTRAGLAKVPLLFLSPIYPTRSHPDWTPLPRMTAAALLRLTKAPVIALGGMNAQRFRRVKHLGFSGWAGIGAYGH